MHPACLNVLHYLSKGELLLLYTHSPSLPSQPQATYGRRLDVFLTVSRFACYTSQFPREIRRHSLAESLATTIGCNTLMYGSPTNEGESFEL